jgi:hypothetical protein
MVTGIEKPAHFFPDFSSLQYLIAPSSIFFDTRIAISFHVWGYFQGLLPRLLWAIHDFFTLSEPGTHVDRHGMYRAGEKGV